MSSWSVCLPYYAGNFLSFFSSSLYALQRTKNKYLHNEKKHWTVNSHRKRSAFEKLFSLIKCNVIRVSFSKNINWIFINTFDYYWFDRIGLDRICCSAVNLKMKYPDYDLFHICFPISSKNTFSMQRWFVRRFPINFDHKFWFQLNTGTEKFMMECCHWWYWYLFMWQFFISFETTGEFFIRFLCL